MLLLDRADRLLVLRAHDPHQPERSWWFTPGGGIDPGETARACAVRELREETGYVIAESALEGPVWERTAIFDFLSQPYVQHEVFFKARLDDATAVEETAWSINEMDTIDGMEWLTHAEIATAEIEVFPQALRGQWYPFLEWDGRTWQLGSEGP